MNYLKVSTRILQNKFTEPYLLTTCFIGAVGGMSMAVSSKFAFDIGNKVCSQNNLITPIYKSFIIIPLYWTSVFGMGIIGCITGPITVPLMIGYIPYKLYKKI
jgi:hypothetical protein